MHVCLDVVSCLTTTGHAVRIAAHLRTNQRAEQTELWQSDLVNIKLAWTMTFILIDVSWMSIPADLQE